MANRPSVPEIITVNSEELQTQIRDLLPSQNGFGSELQASNVIMPIIDLTATAEGSRLPESLQTALGYGSQTTFSISNTSQTLANSAGFYRIYGQSTVKADNAAGKSAKFELTRSPSPAKIIWEIETLAISSNSIVTQLFDLIVWLTPGDTVDAVTTADAIMTGSIRQIATSDGSLVQPSGFPS